MAHAARLIAELIGDAFIRTVERNRHGSFDRARAAWRWLLETTAAPPGIEIVASDGSTYSGLVLVDRSRAVMLIALRHPPHPRRLGAEGEEWEERVRHQSLFDEDDSAQDERNPLYRR